MGAPDKIYLAFKDGFVAQSANNKDAILKKYVPLTYIRKDALMEWVKEKQYESLTIVADNFWQEVIDKLNEM